MATHARSCMVAEVPDAAAAAGHLLLQLPSSYIARDEEVAELALVMADVSTNLVMLTGAGARPVCGCCATTCSKVQGACPTLAGQGLRGWMSGCRC